MNQARFAPDVGRNGASTRSTTLALLAAVLLLAGCDDPTSRHVGVGDVDGSTVDDGGMDAALPDAALPDAALPDASVSDDGGANDACDPELCQNGGTCAADGGVACDCPSGFAGDMCEINIDDCDPNPCMNDGSCIDGVDAFTCVCPPGFTGSTCETAVDHCDPNPCQNGGTCVNNAIGFACLCRGGWSGDTCTECGTPCSARVDYYRDRFLGCFRDESFCGPSPSTCEEFCSVWMDCEGPLEIDSDGVGTVVGPEEECF
jgi:hypothetical protein